jgi:hypothetical protein
MSTSLSRLPNITLQQAYDENLFPYVLVSPQKPFVVQMANDKFTAKFSQTLGAPLSFSQVANDDHLAYLLHSASNGRVVQRRVSLHHPSSSGSEDTRDDDNVLCAPVFEMPSGTVKYLAVFFETSRVLFVHRIASSHSLTMKSSSSTLPDYSSLNINPDQGSNTTSLTVYPRRKSRTKNSECDRSVPVVVTAELLLRLQGLPLPKAAEILGISPTAFKTACRKLSIARWQFKRGCQKSSEEAPAVPFAAAVPISSWPPVLQVRGLHPRAAPRNPPPPASPLPVLPAAEPMPGRPAEGRDPSPGDGWCAPDARAGVYDSDVLADADAFLAC